MSGKDLFSKQAQQYAQYRPRYPKALYAFLASHAPGRESVWDCGTGNGQAAVDLAAFFNAVTATDFSAEQIAQAFPHPRVNYRVAPAYESGLADGSVDLVTVAQAVHWFDLVPFYKEVRRVLRPRGIVAVWAYGEPATGVAPLDSILRRFGSETVGPYWAPELDLVWGQYRALAFPFPELKAPAFDMKATWTLDELLGYLASWSATQRYTDEQGNSPLAELADELAPFWGVDQGGRQDVFWDLALRVGVHA